MPVLCPGPRDPGPGFLEVPDADSRDLSDVPENAHECLEGLPTSGCSSGPLDGHVGSPFYNSVVNYGDIIRPYKCIVKEINNKYAKYFMY